MNAILDAWHCTLLFRRPPSSSPPPPPPPPLLIDNTMLATRPLLSLTLASTRSVGRVGLRTAPSTAAAAVPSMALRCSAPRMVSTSTKTSAPAAAPTTKLTQQQNLDLLNEQRALRPSSPHFTIYQPQITWYLSIINRITGTGLSVCKCLSLLGQGQAGRPEGKWMAKCGRRAVSPSFATVSYLQPTPDAHGSHASPCDLSFFS